VIARILAHLGLPTRAPPRHLRYAILLRLSTSPSLPWLVRSLLNRSSPRTVVRSPQNGLIPHRHYDSIRFSFQPTLPYHKYCK
jgi:hypothetical protein